MVLLDEILLDVVLLEIVLLIVIEVTVDIVELVGVVLLVVLLVVVLAVVVLAVVELVVTWTVVLAERVLSDAIVDADPVVIVVIPVDEGMTVMLGSVDTEKEVGDSDVNNVSEDQKLVGATPLSSQVVHVTSLVFAGGRQSSGSMVASYSPVPSMTPRLLGGGIGQSFMNQY